MTRMSEDDLSRIEALDKAATPGPWWLPEFAPQTPVSASAPEDSLLGLDVDGMAQVWTRPDAEFIAASRLLLPRAASEIRSLRAEVERLRGIKPELLDAPLGPDLPRYGIRWNGPSEPLAVRMDDGYWTPWHLAAAEVERLTAERDAAVAAERERCARIAEERALKWGVPFELAASAIAAAIRGKEGA